jgi:intraflagellar transport protein 52
VFIKDVSMVRSLDVLSGKTKNSKNRFEVENDPFDEDKLKIVYPYGATLEVRPPAVPLLSSGFLSFPQNRCLCACSAVGRGKLMVLGSAHCWEDQYFPREDNAMLATALFRYMTETVETEVVDPDRPEFGDIVQIPDTEALAERLRPCLQESEELPSDFTQMFDNKLYKYDTSLIPEAVALYDKVNVKHEPLTLIRPQFEVPLPPLQPAVWMPCLRELPPPALDLFDLDEDFASEKLRLAQLTNKCTDNDLEFFVREAGEILGVSDQIRTGENGDGDAKNETPVVASKRMVTAKEILEFILVKLVNYKKIEQEGHLQFNATADSEGLNNGGYGQEKTIVTSQGESMRLDD